MLPRDVLDPPTRRWRGTAVLVAVTAGAVAFGVWRTRHVAPAATRTAIRVACTDRSACSFAEALALDVWSEQRGPGMPLDVVVASSALPLLDAANVAWETLVPDIDAVATDEAARLHAAGRAPAADWFAEYRDYDAISAHLRELAQLAPDRVALQAIGGSIEGRPLWALRIGAPGRGATPMLIDGTQHAREWISAMAMTCVADRLVRDYDRDPAVRDFVDHTELWVVPVANPDGYQYSWSTDRYWRKNRHGGHGVDLNRNFSVAWGGKGSGRSERSEDYRGEYAFSEPETIALRDLVKREHVALHIDFHAYGQLVMYPWNYTSTRTEDHARFAAAGDRMASAMFAAHDTRYALIQGVDLYPSAGTMADWMYGEASAQSFSIELRPGAWPGKGRYGFVLPPAQIRPTCDEAFAAVLAMRAYSSPVPH